MFTFSNILFFIVVAIVLVCIVVCVGVTTNSAPATVISGIICVALMVGMVAGVRWYNTSTASGKRAYKDYQSEMNNGIEREITITAEDGREIFHYEGKVDVESDHDDNYIKFESEEGKRYLIYYGITDTIVIKEK